ncbi:MAG: BatD family protein [candidate division Zixibacteria bacterium]|nr:BatD family protein [candidate division Zixibacteria bacterium]
MVCGTVSAVGQGDDVTLTVSLDRDTIGLDEHATLQIIVAGTSQDLPNPQVPTLAAFEVYSQGRSSNFSIINGQVTSSVTYRYLLMPRKHGVFVIDNIAIVHSKKRYKGNPVELTVLNTGTSASSQLQDEASASTSRGKDHFLEAVIDKKNPYVNEQVTLTLKFCIAIQYYGSPELSEPTTTGFWTELLGNKAPYRQKINNRTYKIIERKYALFPTQTGDLTIGRATIRVNVPARGNRGRDPFSAFGDFFNTGKEISVSSKPIRINVRSLPDEGRPVDFTGSIGNFKISGKTDKREVEVNQPVTLTLRISGTGNIKAAAEPVIPELDEFRIYRASSSENITKVKDRIGGSKIYEEVFIPKRPGTLEIPAISYNYFVPSEGRYRTIATAPIKLRVIKPEGYVAATDAPFARPSLLIGSDARDIRYIKTDAGEMSLIGRVFFTTPVYLVVNGLPVLVLAGMIFVRRRRERLASDVSYARSRQAGKLARKRLARARSLAKPDQAGDFFAEVHFALTSYVADKLNISPHGLTTDSLRELLEERSVEEVVIEDVCMALQKCDFGRFAPAETKQENIDQLLLMAEQIMIHLEGVRFA